MDNLKQSLLECIADWISSEETIFEMSVMNLKDNEDLHIDMAEIAFNVFIEKTKKNESNRQNRIV